MTAPTGPEWWLQNLANLEDMVADFDDGLRGSGASGEVRAELSDRFREVALLHPDDPSLDLCAVALMVDLCPFLEADLRAAGHDADADTMARLAAAVSMKLELPADLAVFAGHPIT